jgi:hypothetical protein
MREFASVLRRKQKGEERLPLPHNAGVSAAIFYENIFPYDTWKALHDGRRFFGTNIY